MHVDRVNEGLSIELASEDDTARLGRAIAQLAGPGVVIGLVGPLGAGKTRLARAIAEALGVDPAAISSPTFVLIHEYAGDIPIYHVDAYRLRRPGRVSGPGHRRLLGRRWPRPGRMGRPRAQRACPTDAWWIDLTLTGPTSRTARFEPPPAEIGLADDWPDTSRLSDSARRFDSAKSPT